ncbi:WhiB family transcriptional regulator [Mycolicibacterium tusciae]|uniref:WhiB family transcriptional regulator n=1 Tax=Mycolicibacterium tusciae TaxID=75922 RepID=UPI00024A3ACC|nr:WhiB family transcriptional regulator [Mycolicibacterium tusciae]
MNTAVGQPNARWISHRIAAHRMHRRGQSLDTIADNLRVTKRSVSRYLALPIPEPLAPEVSLADFHLDGACREFPEYDWLSRSPGVQAECKAICEYCPVLQKCRAYGLTNGRDAAGILGGLTTNERQRLIRERTACGQRHDGVAADQQQGAA